MVRGRHQKCFEIEIHRQFSRIKEAKDPMAAASPNILVVEDDRETRTLIAKYLRTNSCNVTTASDGREMARAMAAHRVDLLILDVAARRGRPEPVPQGARRIPHADPHADRARRG